MDRRKILFILVFLVIASSFGYALFSPFTNTEEKDSDGDGIPDIHEKILGLNPYEKNDLNDLKEKLDELNSMVLKGEISISEYNELKRLLLMYMKKLNKTWSK